MRSCNYCFDHRDRKLVSCGNLYVNSTDSYRNPKCDSENASYVLEDIHISEAGRDFGYPYLIQRNNHDLRGGRAALHCYDESHQFLVSRYYIQFQSEGNDNVNHHERRQY